MDLSYQLAAALRDAVDALAMAHIYVDVEAGPDEAEQVRAALTDARAALAAYEAERATPAAAAGEHTAEPWRIESDPVDVLDVCGAFVATTLAPQSSVGSARDYANARRIVACVNACAGIPTAALEAPGAGMVWTADS